MPLRILQTVAESGNIFELTFTLYEERAGPFSANGQTNSRTSRIPFHLREQREQSKTKNQQTTK